MRIDDNGITVVTQEKNNQVAHEPKIDATKWKISWLGIEMPNDPIYLGNWLNLF